MRAKDLAFDRPFRFRDGAIFNAFSHHFVVGYFQMSLPPSPFGLRRTGPDEVLSEFSLALS
jgi:hypothetical protein